MCLFSKLIVYMVLTFVVHSAIKMQRSVADILIKYGEGDITTVEYKMEQGTVIYGIKSEKYPSFPCYGIIITARCDIAQDKVPKYYYLVGVDASAWFSTKHGYQLVYGDTIKEKMKQVCDKAAALELDGRTLISIPREHLQIILEDKKQQLAGNNKQLRKVDDLLALIEKYIQVAQTEAQDIHRKNAIRSNEKEAIKYIKDIDSGKLHHYHFVPQNAYLETQVKSKGIIIDFLEIRSFTLEDAKKIATPLSSANHTESGIYYNDLPKLPTREELTCETNLDEVFKKFTEYSRLKSNYWLEDEDDFVKIDGTIKSPWCEHLMQRFSNVFARIGLDNPSEDDFKNLIQACYQEGIS